MLQGCDRHLSLRGLPRGIVVPQHLDLGDNKVLEYMRDQLHPGSELGNVTINFEMKRGVRGQYAGATIQLPFIFVDNRDTLAEVWEYDSSLQDGNGHLFTRKEASVLYRLAGSIVYGTITSYDDTEASCFPSFRLPVPSGEGT